MILVDTSVWADHLRKGDPALAGLLDRGRVLSHPFVVGELALGRLRQRRLVLDALGGLPQAIVASTSEVMAFIEANGLAGSGIGYIDVHLLASTRLGPAASLWTRDRRLLASAERLGVAAGK